MNIVNIRFLFPVSQHYVSSPTYIFIFFFTGKLYSIIYDGIQKISRELNGVMTRHKPCNGSIDISMEFNWNSRWITKCIKTVR